MSFYPLISYYIQRLYQIYKKIVFIYRISISTLATYFQWNANIYLTLYIEFNNYLISIYLSICLSVYLSIYLSIYLPIYLLTQYLSHCSGSANSPSSLGQSNSCRACTAPGSVLWSTARVLSSQIGTSIVLVNQQSINSQEFINQIKFLWFLHFSNA